MSELRIIDADGHAGEDVNAIAEDFEPPFGTRKFFFPLWPGDGRFRGARISSTPARLWQDYMDAVGIQCAVLYPTLGLSHGLIQEADISTSQNTSEKNQKHQRQILHQYTAFEFIISGL